MRLVIFLILFFIAFNSFAEDIDSKIQETEKALEYLTQQKLMEYLMGKDSFIKHNKDSGMKDEEILYGAELTNRIKLMQTRLANLKQQKTEPFDCKNVYQTEKVFTGVNDIAEDMIEDGIESGGIGGGASIIYGGMLKGMYGAIPQGVRQGNSNCYQQ